MTGDPPWPACSSPFPSPKSEYMLPFGCVGSLRLLPAFCISVLSASSLALHPLYLQMMSRVNGLQNNSILRLCIFQELASVSLGM